MPYRSIGFLRAASKFCHSVSESKTIGLLIFLLPYSRSVDDVLCACSRSALLLSPCVISSSQYVQAIRQENPIIPSQVLSFFLPIPANFQVLDRKSTRL